MIGRVLLLVALFATWAGSVQAELTPDQIVVLGMAESKESGELADYYVKKRGIPQSHIYLIEGDVAQKITRYRWEETVRPGILNWLKRQDFRENVHCLVTTWDVPLEISEINPTSPEITKRREHLEEVKVRYIRQIASLIQMLQSATGQTNAPVKIPDNISTKDLHHKFSEAIKPAQAWLNQQKTPSERNRAGQFVDRVLATIGGNQGLLRLASHGSSPATLSAEKRARIAYLAGLDAGYRRGMEAFSLLRGSVAQDEQMIELAHTMGGLFGAIQWIDQQLYLLKKNFSAASFDSELSLLLWSDPPIMSWISNPWHYSHDGSPGLRANTLMVSRLSGPTPAIVRRMIDDGMAAEKTSLTGVVYLDARGLRFESRQSGNNVFLDYDRSLADLADRLRRKTSLKVVFDDKPELFRLGSCPEAALYCGWQSSEKYIDAFSWSKGAVAYHLSGLEAQWLQLNDDSRVQTKIPWCPSLLADGACATLGSCREGFITSFPQPDDFFSLLLTGKYCLAEVYYRTVPFISWTTVLVGDPLYTPYKNSPQLSLDALPKSMNPGAGNGASARHENSSTTNRRSSQPRPQTPESQNKSSSDKEKKPVVLPGLDL